MAVVVGVIVLVCLFQYAFKPVGRNYVMTADQSTHHGGSFPRGGVSISSGPPPDGLSPSLLRSSSNFIKSIVDKTGNKNRRPSAGKKGVYEMVPGSGNTGKSPFTIAGEDDEEEADLGVEPAEAEGGGSNHEEGF